MSRLKDIIKALKFESVSQGTFYFYFKENILSLIKMEFSTGNLGILLQF